MIKELTPLALKLRTAYRNSDATGDALWNEMAGVVEAELAAPRPVRLPTAEEARQAIADRYPLEGYPAGDYSDWCASVVLDLAAKLNPRDGRLIISTLEGLHWADPGDWIIRGVQGEFYPCKPDIFAATYEPAGGATL